MTRTRIDQDIVPMDRLTTKLPDAWEVTVGLAKSEVTLCSTLADVEVVLVTSRIPLTRRVLEATSALEVVGKLGTGTDTVALDVAAEQGITVTYTPGFNAMSVAEHTLCLLLGAVRRLRLARVVLDRNEWRDTLPLGSQLSGSTVGIVGFGNVGKRLGTLLTGFDTDVLVADPYVPDIDTQLVHGTPVSLSELLERSDAVCLTTELTDETRHLIGAEELATMKSSAVLVNTARGAVVDESALVDALRSGTIVGAGLDVFEDEPLTSDSPLVALDNVVLTPHVGAMTAASRFACIDKLVDNVRALRAGESVADRYLAADPAQG